MDRALVDAYGDGRTMRDALVHACRRRSRDRRRDDIEAGVRDLIDGST